MNNYAYFFVSKNTYYPNSLVGTKINPIGPSFFSTALWALTWTSRGQTYAIVLPDPVFATPITFLPDNKQGKA